MDRRLAAAREADCGALREQLAILRARAGSQREGRCALEAEASRQRGQGWLMVELPPQQIAGWLGRATSASAVEPDPTNVGESGG